MKLPLKPGTGAGQLCDADGHLLAVVFANGVHTTTFEEDCNLAEEVAKRVNLYDELVAALKMTLVERPAVSIEAVKAVLAKVRS